MYRIASIPLILLAALCGRIFAQEAPATAELLSWTPEEAYVSVAVPPVRALEKNAAAFAQRLLPPGLDVRGLFGDWLAPLAAMSPQTNAKTLARIMRASGLDPERPAALFLDWTPLKENVGALAEVADTASLWNASVNPDEARWVYAVVALPVLDAAIAEQTTQGLLGLAQAGMLEYRMLDGWLFVFNNAALLDKVLARRAAPRLTVYGTAECAPEQPDEIVMLTRMDKVQTLLPDMQPVARALGADEASSKQADDQLQFPRGAFTDPDPCVTTLHFGEDGLALTARLNLERHAAYAAMIGLAPPADFAAGVGPASTLMLLGNTPEYKQQFQQRPFSQLPISGDLAQYMGVLDNALSATNTLALAFSTGEVPHVEARIEASDAAALTAIVLDMAPMKQKPGPDEKTHVFEIESAFPIHYVVSGDRIGVAPSEEVAIQHASGQGGTLGTPLAKLDPPVSQESGVFSLISVGAPELAWVAGFFQSADGAPSLPWLPPLIERKVLREVRAGKLVDKNWHKLFFSIHLN